MRPVSVKGLVPKVPTASHKPLSSSSQVAARGDVADTAISQSKTLISPQSKTPSNATPLSKRAVAIGGRTSDSRSPIRSKSPSVPRKLAANATSRNISGTHSVKPPVSADVKSRKEVSLGLSLPTGVKLSLELDHEVVRRVTVHSSLLNEARELAGLITNLHAQLQNGAVAIARARAPSRSGSRGGSRSSLASPPSAAATPTHEEAAAEQQAAAAALLAKINNHVSSLINVLLRLRLASVAVVEAIVAWRAVQHELITARYLVKESTNASLPPWCQRLLSGSSSNGGSAAGASRGASRRRARFADGTEPGGSPGKDAIADAAGAGFGGNSARDAFGSGADGNNNRHRQSNDDDQHALSTIEFESAHSVSAVFSASTALAAAAQQNGAVNAAVTQQALADNQQQQQQPMNGFARALSEAMRQIPIYTYGGSDYLGYLVTSLDFLATVEPLVQFLGVEQHTLPLNPFMSPASLKQRAEATIAQAQLNSDGNAGPSDNAAGSVAELQSPIREPATAQALASQLHRPTGSSHGRRGRSAIGGSRPATSGLLGLGDEEDALNAGGVIPGAAAAPLGRSGSGRSLGGHGGHAGKQIPILVTSVSNLAPGAGAGAGADTVEEADNDNEDYEDDAYEEDSAYDDDEFEDDANQQEEKSKRSSAAQRTPVAKAAITPACDGPAASVANDGSSTSRSGTNGAPAFGSTGSANAGQVDIGVPAEGRQYLSSALHLMGLSDSPLVRAIGKSLRAVFDVSNSGSGGGGDNGNDGDVSTARSTTAGGAGSNTTLPISEDTSLESRIASAEQVLLYHSAIITGDVPLQVALRTQLILPPGEAAFVTNEPASALRSVRKKMLTNTGEDDTHTLLPTLISYAPDAGSSDSHIPVDGVGGLRALVGHIGATAGRDISAPPSAFLAPVSFVAAAQAQASVAEHASVGSYGASTIGSRRGSSRSPSSSRGAGGSSRPGNSRSLNGTSSSSAASSNGPIVIQAPEGAGPLVQLSQSAMSSGGAGRPSTSAGHSQHHHQRHGSVASFSTMGSAPLAGSPAHAFSGSSSGLNVHTGPSPYSVVDKHAMQILTKKEQQLIHAQFIPRPTSSAYMSQSASSASTRPRTGHQPGGRAEARGTGVAAVRTRRATMTVGSSSGSGSLERTGTAGSSSAATHSSALLSASIGSLSGVQTQQQQQPTWQRVGPAGATSASPAPAVEQQQHHQHAVGSAGLEFDFTSYQAQSPPASGRAVATPSRNATGTGTASSSTASSPITGFEGNGSDNAADRHRSRYSDDDGAGTAITGSVISSARRPGSVAGSVRSSATRGRTQTSARPGSVAGSVRSSSTGRRQQQQQQQQQRPGTSAGSSGTPARRPGSVVRGARSVSPVRAASVHGARASTAAGNGRSSASVMSGSARPGTSAGQQHQQSQQPALKGILKNSSTSVPGELQQHQQLASDPLSSSAVHVSTNRKDAMTLIVHESIGETIQAAWQLTRSVYTNNIRTSAAYETHLARKQAVLEMASSQAITSGGDGKPRSGTRAASEALAATASRSGRSVSPSKPKSASSKPKPHATSSKAAASSTKKPAAATAAAAPAAPAPTTPSKQEQPAPITKAASAKSITSPAQPVSKAADEVEENDEYDEYADDFDAGAATAASSAAAKPQSTTDAIATTHAALASADSFVADAANLAAVAAEKERRRMQKKELEDALTSMANQLADAALRDGQCDTSAAAAAAAPPPVKDDDEDADEAYGDDGFDDERKSAVPSVPASIPASAAVSRAASARSVATAATAATASGSPREPKTGIPPLATKPSRSSMSVAAMTEAGQAAPVSSSRTSRPTTPSAAAASAKGSPTRPSAPVSRQNSARSTASGPGARGSSRGPDPGALAPSSSAAKLKATPAAAAPVSSSRPAAPASASARSLRSLHSNASFRESVASADHDDDRGFPGSARMSVRSQSAASYRESVAAPDLAQERAQELSVAGNDDAAAAASAVSVAADEPVVAPSLAAEPTADSAKASPAPVDGADADGYGDDDFDASPSAAAAEPTTVAAPVADEPVAVHVAAASTIAAVQPTDIAVVAAGDDVDEYADDTQPEADAGSTAANNAAEPVAETSTTSAAAGEVAIEPVAPVAAVSKDEGADGYGDDEFDHDTDNADVDAGVVRGAAAEAAAPGSRTATADHAAVAHVAAPAAAAPEVAHSNEVVSASREHTDSHAAAQVHQAEVAELAVPVKQASAASADDAEISVPDAAKAALQQSPPSPELQLEPGLLASDDAASPIAAADETVAAGNGESYEDDEFDHF